MCTAAALTALRLPQDKRKIILDEKLATIFTPPITMFSMNKQLSKHVFAAGPHAPELTCSAHDSSSTDVLSYQQHTQVRARAVQPRSQQSRGKRRWNGRAFRPRMTQRDDQQRSPMAKQLQGST